MLLSSAAIGVATERLSPDDFYKPAHANIYDAICRLNGSGEPADVVTVAAELSRAGLLEQSGGPAALLGIQAGTPATSNAGRYTRIVEDHAVLRRLIGVAGDIAELGYGRPDDVTKAVDVAESMVFGVAQRRVTDSMMSVHDMADEFLTELEARYEAGNAVTGVPTGFTDLDDLLLGLQPGALYILGARPSAGKTALALGIAGHVAVHQRKPTVVFSLEMSHSEVTQRLMCAEGRVDSKRIRTGQLTAKDWASIAQATGRLADAPMDVDDNPNATVMEIRSKARRLQGKYGQLGLIVVDYIQLMGGRGTAENRQVAVSEISRSLKVLARELECPILALSQLSRSLEMRSDKRPMLSDLRESGCLTGDTRIVRADTGVATTMADLFASGEKDVPVWSMDDRYRITSSTMTHVFETGTRSVFELTMASGRRITATSNHRFVTVEGWRSLGDLEPGQHLAVPRYLPSPVCANPMADPEVVMLAHLLGDGTVLARQPIHYTNPDEANVRVVEEAATHWGITPRRVRQKNWWHVYLPSPYQLTHGVRNPIQVWWRSLGLFDRRSWQKFIPDVVFGQADEQVALFLHHLWATDGSVHMRTDSRGHQVVSISYSSTSRRLIDGVQSLLLRFGVTSRIQTVDKDGYRPCYNLCLFGSENQIRFITSVGVNGVRGEVAQQALAVLRLKTPNPNIDTVPHAARAQVVAALKAAGHTQRSFAEAINEQYCGSYLLGSPKKPRSYSRSRLQKMASVLNDEALTDLATSDVEWDEIASIEPLGEQPVYDATVLGTHNFVGNGIIAHNSIEQDSDVVMFIFRDEMYRDDSPDRGMAEVIVAKHRNGPTGVVKLAFLGHYTKFANLARV